MPPPYLIQMLWLCSVEGQMQHVVICKNNVDISQQPTTTQTISRYIAAGFYHHHDPRLLLRSRSSSRVLGSVASFAPVSH